MYERLPQELKAHAGFCGWKYEQRDGRKTKVPKTVTGRNADISSPSGFCSFEEIQKKAGDFDGIGIAVRDGLAAIDIDHSITDGSLTELAAGIVEKVRSYTEISPSGEGIRIIGKVSGFTYDSERYYINNRKLGLEVYAPGGKSRFVTVTGNAVRDYPIRDMWRPVVCSNDFEMQRIMSRLRLIWKTIIGLRTQRQIKKNDNIN